MKRYPKLKYPDDSQSSGLFADGEIYVQEKIDGANGRFTLENNIEDNYRTEDRDLVFGSRKITYKNKKDETNQFRSCMNFIRQNVNLNVMRGYDEEYGGIIIYGEYMIPHTIRDGYNWSKWENKFVCFDVWSIRDQRFLAPEKSQQVFENINIPYVPILGHYSIDEWQDGETSFHNSEGNWPDNDKWCPETDFGDGLAEGIVIKNPKTQTYSKMVRSDFREKHKTGNMEKERNGSEKLSYQYITDARIEKTARKLVDEGNWGELTMDMMQDLPREVIKDMANEEGFNIFMYENWEIDLNDFRSITSDRCSRVLRRMIQIESESEL